MTTPKTAAPDAGILPDHTPEQDRLRARFAETVHPDGSSTRMNRVHFSWGPDAAALTDEQRARTINDVLDQDAMDEANTVPIRVSQLREIYKALKRLTRLGQATADEIISETPERRDFRLAVFRLADFPAMFAGQALSREDRETVRREIETAP